MKTKEATQILNKEQTIQKINRISHEILERNFSENEIVLAGVDPSGCILSDMIAAKLKSISDITISQISVTLDKNAPLQSEITLNCDLSTISKKVVILVDDVLNTGRTLAYSFKPFLSADVKKLQVAVVVDRDHKTFPVHADYVGYSLSTTLQEHIKVVLSEDNNIGVYIS